MSDYLSPEDFNFDDLEKGGKEISKAGGAYKSYTPVKKEPAISNFTKEQEQQQEKVEYDGLASVTGKWLTNLAGSIITGATDFVGGVLDVGDWHHTIDALDSIPYAGTALKWGTGLGAVSALSKILDNAIGDGEDYVGNWIMDNSLSESIKDYIAENQINTGSDYDWLLNGSASVLGSGASFGGGISILGKAAMKGIGKTLGGINRISSKAGKVFQPTIKQQKLIAGAVTSGLMTNAISATLGRETYDTVFNDILDENGFTEGKENAYKKSYDNFVKSNKGRMPNEKLIEEATKFASNSAEEWGKSWMVRNPQVVNEAKKAAITGADATMKINAASFALNFTGAMMALRGAGSMVTRGAQTQATRFGILQPGGMKDLALEIGQEFIEEGIIESYAGAKGVAIGKGEEYGITSDFMKDFLTTETLKTAVLTALGTGATVGVTNAFTYKGRKEAADKAQKAVNDFSRRMPTANGVDIIGQTASLQNTYENIANIAEEVENLKKQGKYAEAEELNNSIVMNQAMHSFKTGTADKLIEQYEAVANNQNFDAETRKRAQEIVGEITQFEKQYNEINNKGYGNTDDLFYNRVNSFYLEKGIKELETKIADQKTKAWKDILDNETNLPSKKISTVDYKTDKLFESVEKGRELEARLAESTQDYNNEIERLQNKSDEYGKEISSLNDENITLREEEKSLKEKLAELAKELLDLRPEEETKRKNIENRQETLKTQLDVNTKKQEDNALDINKLENGISNNDKIIKRQQDKIQELQETYDRENEEIREGLKEENLPPDEIELDVNSIEDITEGKDFDLELERQQFSKYREEARKLESVKDLEAIEKNQQLFKEKKAYLDKDYNTFTSKKHQLDLYFQNRLANDLRGQQQKIQESITENNDKYLKIINDVAKKYEGRINKQSLEYIKAKFTDTVEQGKKAIENAKKEQNEVLAAQDGESKMIDDPYEKMVQESYFQDQDEDIEAITQEAQNKEYEQQQKDKLQAKLKSNTNQSKGLENDINAFVGSKDDTQATTETVQEVAQEAQQETEELSAEDIADIGSALLSPKSRSTLFNRIFNGIKNKNGVEPNFEQFVEEFIAALGLDRVKSNFDNIKNTWKSIKGDANFDEVFNKYFGLEKDMESLLSLFEDEDVEVVTPEEIVQKSKETQNQKLAGKELIKTQGEDLGPADMSTIPITFVHSKEDDTGKVVFETGDETQQSNYLLDNDSYQPGQKLIIEPFTDDEIANFKIEVFGFEDKDTALESSDVYDVEEKPTITTFYEYVSSLGLTEDDNLYWEKIPIAVKDEEGNIIGIIKDPSNSKAITENTQYKKGNPDTFLSIEKINNVRKALKEKYQQGKPVALSSTITVKEPGTTEVSKTLAEQENRKYPMADFEGSLVGFKNDNGSFTVFDEEGNEVIVKPEQVNIDNTDDIKKHMSIMLVKTSAKTSEGEPIYSLAIGSAGTLNQNQQSTMRNLMLFYLFYEMEAGFSDLYNSFAIEYNKKSDANNRLPLFEELAKLKDQANEQQIPLALKTTSNVKLIKEFLSRFTITNTLSLKKDGNAESNFELDFRNSRSEGTPRVSISNHGGPSLIGFGLSGQNENGSIGIGSVFKEKSQISFSKQAKKIAKNPENANIIFQNIVDRINALSQQVFPKLQANRSRKVLKDNNVPMFEITQTIDEDGKVKLNFNLTDQNNSDFIRRNSTVNFKPLEFTNKNGETVTTMTTNPKVLMKIDDVDTESINNKTLKEEVEATKSNIQKQEDQIKEEAKIEKEDSKFSAETQEALDKLDEQKQRELEANKDNLNEKHSVKSDKTIGEEINERYEETKKILELDINKKIDEQTEEKIDKLKKDNLSELEKNWDSQLSIVNDIENEDGSTDFILLSPKKIDDESAKEVVQEVNKYYGIQPHHFDSLVNYAYNKIIAFKNRNKNKVLSKDDLDNELSKIFDTTIDEKLNQYNKSIEEVNKYVTDEAKKQKYLAKFEYLINYVENIKSQKDNILKTALDQTNLKITTPEEYNAEQSEENEVEKIYSKSFLEEGGKLSLSQQLKEFLTGIRQLDSEGNPVTGFLGFPSHVPIDEIVGTLQQLLSDTNSNLDNQIKILEQSISSHPYLKEVIENLKNADQKTKNNFASFFDKSQLKMKFILFGQEGNKPFVKVMDTNANTIEKIILSNWNVNLKQSDLIEKNENGQFVYKNVEKAIDKINKFYEGDPVYPNNKLQKKLIANGIKDGKGLKANINSPVFKKLLKNKNNRPSRIILGKSSYDISTDGKILTGNDKPKTSLYDKIKFGQDSDKSITELLDFLKDFGINVSKNTIEHIMSNGVWVKSEARFVKADEIFGTGKLSFFSIIKDNLIRVSDGSLLEGNNFLDQTLFKNLAGLETRFTDSIAPTSFRDDQKLLQGYILKTFVKEREAALKAEDDTTRKNLLKQAFSKRSMLLNLLANNKIRESFEVDYLGLTSLKERRKKSYQSTQLQNLTDADHEFEKLAFYSDMKLGSADIQFEGIATRQAGFFALTMSDKSTMTPIFMPTLDFKESDFEVTDNDIQPGSNMINVMFGQTVLPEIERMLSDLGNNIKGYNKGKNLFLFFPELNSIRVNYKGEEKTFQDFLTIAGKSAVKNYFNNNSSLVAPEHAEYIQKFEEEAKKVLKDTVNKLTKDKLAKWTEYGIVSSTPQSETTVSYGNKKIDKDFLNKFNPENKQLSDNNKINFAAVEFIVNNIISNANQFMLIAGDPAMYFKSKADDFTIMSKDTSLNISKRLAAMIAPGTKLANSDQNSYTQIFVNDAEAPANNLKSIVKLLDNKDFDLDEFNELRSNKNSSNEAKQKYKDFVSQYPNSADYFEIESTDAQEYTTWKEHLYVLEGLGKTQPGLIDSAKLEKAKELIESGKSLKDMTADEKELVKFVFQPIKPVYTGQIVDPSSTEDETLYRTIYIKSSSIPLLPQITEGTQLDVLRQSMEEYEKKNKTTVRLSFNSGNKVGTFANSMSIFDSNGNIIQQDVNTMMDQFDKSSLVLDRNNFRIQQDMPYKGDKETVSQGTQTTKILFGNGVTEMDGFKYTGQVLGDQAFDGSGSRLEREFFNNYSGLIDLEKEKLYAELGIDTNTNTPINVKYTANKLKQLLVKEATERNYDRQVIDSFNINYVVENGEVTGFEFAFPLWLSPSSNRIESLLNSIVTNRIAKVKLPGSSYIVSSPEGYKKLSPEQLNSQGKTFDESRIIHINEDFDGELKGIEINDDGSINHKTQVYLPSRFKTADGQLLDLFKTDENNNYIYVKQTSTGFVLNKEMFDEELLSNISFRIPTSAHQSMLDVEIVGFLPPEAGDLMIVPRNTLVQIGLDFDIDKNTNYNLYHTIDADGKVKVLTDDIKQLKENIDSLQGEVSLLEQNLQTYRTNISEKVSELKSQRDLLNDLKLDEKEEIDALYTSYVNVSAEEVSLENLIENLEEELNTLEDEGVDNLIVSIFNITQEELAEDVENRKQELTELIKNNKLILDKVKEEKETISKDLSTKSKGRVKTKDFKLIKSEIDKLYQERKEKNKFDTQTIAANKIALEAARKKLSKLYKNNIVKIHSSVLSNPKMQSKISKALSMEWAKGQGDYIANLVESANRVEKEKNSMASFTMLSDDYQKDLVTLGAAGKTGIGSYSIDVVFHSLMQQNKDIFSFGQMQFGFISSGGELGGGKTLLPNKVEYFKAKLSKSEDDLAQQIIELLNTGQEENIALAETTMQGLFPQIIEDYNKLERDISDVLTERQNLATDNAKEQVLEKLFLNEETFDVDKVLTLMGFDKDENGNSVVGLFLNQPIIRDYVAFIKNSNSLISEYVADKEEAAKKKFYEKYGITKQTIDKFDINNPDKSKSDQAYKNRELAWESLTGSQLENQIKNKGDRADYQYLLLERFIDLSRKGKQLRKIQSLLNVDSQGLGKSFFDVIAKKKQFESLFLNTETNQLKEVENQFLPMFGEISNKYVNEIDKKNDVVIQIFDDSTAQVFTPTTIAGKMLVENIYSAYNLWSDFFPYDKGVIGSAINQIIELRGINVENQFQYIEAAQKALQEVNKMLNSENFETFSNDNVFDERKRLFTEQDGHSLAKYLNDLKLSNYDEKFNQVVKAIVLANPLIKSLEYEIDNDNGLSLVKYNNATGENIDKNRLYSSIPNLIQYDLPLPDFNGEPYTTRMLAQDLVNYALIEGGVQEAIQFSKHIPLAYLLKTGYLSSTADIDNAFAYITTPIEFSKTLSYPSPWQIQYFQHNFTQLPEISKSEISRVTDDTIIIKDSKDALPMYKYKDKNGDIFPYYRTGPNQYTKAAKLNTFGTNEYDVNAQRAVDTISEKPKEEAKTQLDDLKMIGELINQQEKSGKRDNDYDKNQEDSANATSNKLFVKEQNLSKSLEAISTAKLGNLSQLASLLKSILPPDVKFEIGTSAGDGQYLNNTITLDSDFVENATDNEIAKVLMHEVIHALTATTLKQYVITDSNGAAKLKPNVTVPKEVSNIVRIFNRARKKFNEKHPGKIQAALGKTILDNSQLDVDYGFTSIDEFLTLLATSEDFVKELSTLKYDDNTSILDKLTQALADLIAVLRKNIGLETDSKEVTDAFQAMFQVIELQTGKKINYASTDNANNLISKADELNDIIDSIFDSAEVKPKKKQINVDVNGVKYDVEGPLSSKSKVFDSTGMLVTDKQTKLKVIVKAFAISKPDEYRQALKKADELAKNNITGFGSYGVVKLTENEFVVINTTGVKYKLVKPTGDLINLYGPNTKDFDAVIPLATDQDAQKQLENDVSDVSNVLGGDVLTTGVLFGTKVEPKTETPITQPQVKGDLQKRMTEKLPEIANPTAKKHVPKELVKTRIATQYIGDGSLNSSTDRYRKMYAEEGVANTGNYSSSDIVYVSSNGKRKNRVNPIKDGVLQGEYINVQKAMDAGATIVMDTAAHLKRTANYNIGELALAKYLENNGYKREGDSGIWKPTTQPQATNLGTKTAPVGGNVVIDATKGRSPQPGAIVAFRTKGKTEQNMIDALADNAVGNPFGPYAAIKVNNTGEATTRFLNWLEGTGDTNVMQNYRNALLAKVPELKGKTIYYYKDLGRPSHATALDYFLNKPITQQQVSKTLDTAKEKFAQEQGFEDWQHVVNSKIKRLKEEIEKREKRKITADEAKELRSLFKIETFNSLSNEEITSLAFQSGTAKEGMKALRVPSKTNTITIPDYKIENLRNQDGSKRLASTTKENIIKLNPVSTVQELFDYMEGKEGGMTSMQKQMVLEKLAQKGYDIDRLKSIIDTPQKANLFLILHEQDHVINNDRSVYWNMGKNLLTPDKIAIETRATINALKKLEKEYGISSSKDQPKIKKGVDYIFEENPELSKIGTPELYSQYLDTIFPDSKVKNIVYHTSLEKNIDKFRDSAYGIHFGTIQAGIDRIKGLQYSGDISDGGLSLTNVAEYIQRTKEDLATFDFDEYTGEETINFPSDDEVIKYISKAYPSILNITSLKTTKDIGDDAQWKNKLNKINNTEGYSYQNLNEDRGSISFVVKNSEQIHMLGSKEDIKGFKKFVENNESKDQPKLSPKNMEIVERQFGLRNEDGSRKRFIKKSYKSTLKKTIALNKANPQYKFRIITVKGEKGDQYRVYDAISVSPRPLLSPKRVMTKQIENSVISGANKKQIENIINDFENTCK